MIDYASFPPAGLVRVINPQHQAGPGDTPGPYNNVAFGIPAQLLSRYFRRARPDMDPPVPEWWLPADHQAWSELMSYQDALRFYAELHRPTSSPNAESLAQQMDADRRRVAREQFWSAVRALPGGTDPDWQYSSHGEDRPDDPLDDDRFKLWDWSNPERPPRYPRRDLRARHGTTSIIFFAELNGLTLPP